MPVTTRDAMIRYSLRKLGISDTSSTRPEYLAVNDALDISILQVITTCEFTDMVKREKLIPAPETVPSNTFYQYRYSCPVNMAKSLELTSGVEYFLEGKNGSSGQYLFTNESPSTYGPVLRFLFNPILADAGWTDLQPYFYDTLAYKAASIAAAEIKSSVDIVERMEQMYQRYSKEARTYNLQNKTGKPVRKSGWGGGWSNDYFTGEI